MTRIEDRRDEERDAWNLYWANTRSLSDGDYYRVEPWAWRILSETLLAIEHKYRERVAA